MDSNDELWEVLHGLFKEPIVGPLKCKMAEIRHLENRQIAIFQRKIIRFFDICYTTASFPNSRWRTAAILKIVSLAMHNSATDCPISVKFCIGKQTGMSIEVQ